MVRAVVLIFGIIPIIFAILIAVPMITKPEIPTGAVVPEDKITIEYTTHELKVVSFGVTERTGSLFTEILTVKDDGEIKYSTVIEGYPQPEKKSKIGEEKLKKLTAIIKETGFMEIPSDTYPVKEGIEEYKKSTIKVTLNGKTKQIYWLEQNATENFIPPIITMIELELNQIIEQLNQ